MELAEARTVFSRYTLKRKLGQGGMGVVWLAHDAVLEQEVALKFVGEHLAHDRQAIDRLRHETRRNLRLAHPNIVRIYDFAQGPDGAAIAMEYVDGPSLWTVRIRKTRPILGVGEVSPWLRDLCVTLDYAHQEARIVHRDLNSANLMFNQRGQLKVTDFGLAREIRRTRPADPAQPHYLGTEFYMSPQQWSGEAASVGDDIYSLGATLYELLTSKPPFFEGNIYEQVQGSTPPTLTERLFELGFEDVEIPLVWEETIAACLAKQMDHRPGSAGQVAFRLGLATKSKTGQP
jgi:eukaryotic-like serine/threonine-protein kinase